MRSKTFSKKTPRKFSCMLRKKHLWTTNVRPELRVVEGREYLLILFRVVASYERLNLLNRTAGPWWSDFSGAGLGGGPSWGGVTVASRLARAVGLCLENDFEVERGDGQKTCSFHWKPYFFFLADWDFILILIALSLAAFALIIYCCFHRKCHPWILSYLHPSWQGWTDNRRHLPRTSSINSLQRYEAFASRTPQSFPVAESSCNVWFVPSALHREAFVHFRRPSIPKDGPASLFKATPGSGAGCGLTSETILEMEDEF